MSADALDPQLRRLFLQEAEALLGRIEALLGRCRAAPADAPACRHLAHALHTLKGLSHTAGAHGLAALVQEMELGLRGLPGGVPDPSGRAHLAAACRGLRGHFLRLQDPAAPQEAAPVALTPELLVRRLEGAAGQAALEVGKRVRLGVLGEAGRVPAAILETLAGPLEHLVRNAVVHGVEAPGDRVRQGKPAQGEVRLEFREDGAQIWISVSDDGAGVDEAAVAARARQLGWLAPEAPAAPERLHECLFRPGFSTAGTVTAVAGLGLGLDAVRAAVAGLGGDIGLESRAGAGTRFTLRLPRAAARAVLPPSSLPGG